MTPRDPTRPDTGDQKLRQQMLDALTRAPAIGTEALQERALAQWRLRASGGSMSHDGTIGALQNHWRHHPGAWFAAALLVSGLLMLTLLRPWTSSDPALEELMQPDLLSLIAIGEL